MERGVKMQIKGDGEGEIQHFTQVIRYLNWYFGS